MKFKDIERTKDGALLFNVEATQDEVSFLVDFAVNRLLAEGVIALNEADTEQEVTLHSPAH